MQVNPDETTPAAGASGSAPSAAMTAAQKTARQNAQSAKASYEGALNESTAILPNDLGTTLQQNNTKFRQLPHGNNKTALDEMDAAENTHLGSLNNDEKTSLKQVQLKRRDYMGASMASTRTAARHDHISGIVPFQLADKKKSVFSERSQGIIRNYFDGLRDFNPAKKAIMARREAIASKEAKAAQEFLADMEAKRNPNVDNARDAVQGMNEAATAARNQDATAAAQLEGLAKVTNEGVQEADALEVGGAPARTTQEQTEEKTQDLYAELQKNDKKEIVYNTQSGQHRITFDKASGTFSSKNPEALAKFIAAHGDPDFKITHGSGEAGLDLLHHLVKEGVQDVSMTPEMRGKIKNAGGEDIIRIADARSETFKNTSAVEQGERSLNALTFTRMTSPEDASARKTFNKEYCTNEDRKDMLGILKENLEQGKITQEQFAQEAKAVLSPVNLETKSELTADLSPELKAAIDAPTPSPTPQPTVAMAATTAGATTIPAPSPPPAAPPVAPIDTTTQDSTANVTNAAAPDATQTQTEPQRPNKPLPATPTNETATQAQAANVATAQVTTNQAQTQAQAQVQPQTQAQAQVQPQTLSQPTPTTTPASRPPTPQASASSAPSAAPTTPAPRPTWTQMGMKEARDELKGANKTENKSNDLAGMINNKLNSFQSLGQGKLDIIQNKIENMKQYLEGIKNFLKGPENNNTATKFTDTVAALAINDPSTLAAALPQLDPKELGDVIDKISKHDDPDKAEKALNEMDKKSEKGDKSSLEKWKDHHLKSSSEKENTHQKSSDPKQQDKSEVEKVSKKYEEAKTKVAEAKKTPQQQQTAQGPSPGGGGSHGK